MSILLQNCTAACIHNNLFTKSKIKPIFETKLAHRYKTEFIIEKQIILVPKIRLNKTV